MNTQTDKTELLDCFADDFHPMVFLAKKAGPDVANSFMEYCGGTKPHIPTKDNFWSGLEHGVRDETLRMRFNGRNYEQLAMEFSLSERQVRNIVNKDHRPRYRQVDEGRALRFGPAHVDRLKAVAEQYGNVSMAAVAMVIVEAAIALPEVRAALAAAFDSGQSSLLDDEAA